MCRSGSIGSSESTGASPPDRLLLSSATPAPGAGRVSPSRLARATGRSTQKLTAGRRLYCRDGYRSIMDRVERGLAAEPEPESEEPFGSALGLENRRAVVEFLAVLVVVMVLAAATSVVLVPA